MLITCEKKNEMYPWTRMVIENRVKIKIILFCYLFHETSCKLNCYIATQEEFLRVSQLISVKPIATQDTFDYQTESLN